MRREFCNIPVLFFSLVLAYPAWAAEPLIAINFKGIYEFGFSGVPFGKMGIEAEQEAGHYSVASDIKTTGLINLFVRHSSHTTVDAEGNDFSYPDIAYESHYQTKGKKRYVKMAHADGALTEEKALPPDPPEKRQPVAMALKKNAADPLSLILRMREQLAEALRTKKSAFALNAYDGRRLTEVDFAVQGGKTILYEEKKLPVIAVAVRRKLIAGFTKSELEEHNPNEPTLYIYFTDDARLIPIRLEATMWFGKVTATLAKECRTGESCLLGLKE